MSNEGKKVKVHYTGTLNDGTKFDSSYDRNAPLEFTCMAGQMIEGFDKAVKDMEVGQTVNVHLLPREAYGDRNPAAIQTIPMSILEGSGALKVGQKVMLTAPDGRPIAALVAAVEDGKVTFDMNHELAGQELNFEITLLEAN